MPHIEFACEIDAPLERVWQFHDTIETLFQLTPPHTKARLGGAVEPMRVGAIYRLHLRRMGVPLPVWEAEIIAYEPPRGFTDRQIPGRGPFKSWTREHHFESLAPNRTRITDRVNYEAPFGVLGKIADWLFLRRDITQMFAYRYRVTRKALAPSLQNNKQESEAP